MNTIAMHEIVMLFGAPDHTRRTTLAGDSLRSGAGQQGITTVYDIQDSPP